MKKINIVKNNRDFDNIIKNGYYAKNSIFVIYYIVNDTNNYHIGISVGKKIGNAVIRNYYKRIIRNICDNHKNLYSNHLDYIIIIRKGCLNTSFNEIEKSLIELFIQIEKENRYEQK